MSGYCYRYTDKLGHTWGSAPDTDWDLDIVEASDRFHYQGVRVIDGVRVNVWRMSGTTAFVAQVAH
jgi:hypothetical protein